MENYELQVVDTKNKNERIIISDFVIPNHLTASCRNEIELEAQTKDLEMVCFVCPLNSVITFRCDTNIILISY
jgi:hypothetical protein